MGESENLTTDLELSLGFTGNHQVKLDSALRIPVPSKFREVLNRQFAASAGHLIVVPNSNCLTLYPFPVWQKIKAEVESLSAFDPNGAKYRRVFFGNTHACQLDSANRIKLTPALCKAAKLDKEVTVVGQEDRMELWDVAAWDGYNSDVIGNLDEVMAGIYKGLQGNAARG